MVELYPEIEPFDRGHLDVRDDNHIYWERCGNPNGKPVVVLHGGPGSGSSAGFRRYFDPTAYQIILFDQRGCGRSRPHASNPQTNLSVNTTHHLISDMEKLREHFRINRWMIYGGSWGSTLGLAYAEQYPHRVSEIVMVGVTMTRRAEIDWLYRGVGRLFPEQWSRFQAGAPPADRQGDLIAAYYRLLHDPDPQVRAKAAADFHEWEAALISVDPDAKPGPHWYDPEFQMARARIITHYFHHNAWLEDGILLRETGSLAGIPGVLIHGRLDLGSPLITAWELAQAWPDSELIVVKGAGHSSNDPGMGEAVIEATNRFARR
ncbi:MAG: prolyl aminopeptidase [Ardenticatenaceae bacterium]|nr:prolyl aminopeptidase [Ardenticatenaceae bacterium]